MIFVRSAPSILAAITLLATVPEQPTGSTPPPAACTLQQSEIDGLIRAGMKAPGKDYRDPQPIKLRVGGLRKWTVGTVYPPRLRVQMAARAAQLAYKPFTVDEVTPEMCQNVTFVSGTPWVGHSVTDHRPAAEGL